MTTPPRSKRVLWAVLASLLLVATAAGALVTHGLQERHNPLAHPQQGDRISAETYFDSVDTSNHTQQHGDLAGNASETITSVGATLPITAVGISPDHWVQVGEDIDRVYRNNRSEPLDSTHGVTNLYFHRDYGLGSAYQRSPLWDLASAKPGTSITLDIGNKDTAYRVTKVETVQGSTLPSAVMSHDGTHRLAIITCGGDMLYTSRGTWTWAGRTIIWASPTGH